MSTRAFTTRRLQHRDLISRVITLRAATLDEANRSVEVTIATEGRVLVTDWQRGEAIEEILLAGGAAFPAQLPLLDSHARESVQSVYGSVRDIRRDGGAWIGRAYFASDPASLRAWAKVRDRHLTDVSVGYHAAEFIDIPAGTARTVAGREYTAGKRTLRITTRWEAKELSLIPIGADPAAKVRTTPATTTTQAKAGGAIPARRQTPPAPRPAPPRKPAPSARTVSSPHPAAAGRRSTQPSTTFTGGSSMFLYTRQFKQRHGYARWQPLAVGLMIRAGLDLNRFVKLPNGHKCRLDPEDAEKGRAYGDLSLLEMMREVAYLNTSREADGREETLRAAVSGGALANIFTTSVNAMLLMAWQEEEDTTVGWASETDVANFKTLERVGLDQVEGLARLPRGQKAKDVGISDSKEEYRIARYARKFTVDEQDIIDDNFDVLSDSGTILAQAARRLRPDLVYSILLANAAMADGTALFHTDHANLGSGAGSVLAKAGLQAGITAMSSRSGYSIKPRTLIVPQDLSWTARELITSAQILQATGSDTTLEFGRNVLVDENLELRVDNRISTAGVTDPATETTYTGTATNWFLAARPGRTIEVAYLAGTNRMPVVRASVLDQGQYGIAFDCKLDIGAKALDYRGLYKSAGA